MKNTRHVTGLAFCVWGALCVVGSGVSLGAAAANEPVSPQTGTSGAVFPNYSRQEIVEVCLSEYGMENTSILECVANDKKYQTALAKMWPDFDEASKNGCLVRLADHHLNSYFHLDRCIRASKKDADSSD